jgi:hypothetical protein
MIQLNNIDFELIKKSDELRKSSFWWAKTPEYRFDIILPSINDYKEKIGNLVINNKKYKY